MPLNLHMTNTMIGLTALVIFVLAYVLIICEEFIQLRKSKPIVLAAGVVWLLVAIAAKSKGMSAEVQAAVKHNLLEYAELLLFLLVAMTYVNAMEDRNIFEALKGWLVKKRFSYRALFWITGWLAFFISPMADNMTTALIMCAIIMAVGQDKPQFIAISCINIVVAANAGGAFCPFGDITTLMVWQAGIIPFEGFFKLFFPSLINFLLPAAIMHFAIPKDLPPQISQQITIARGGISIVILFFMTLATSVCFHHFYSLPPVLGMMTGLAYLKLLGFYLNKNNNDQDETFDVFRSITKLEWDTLLFFYGVILCVGGLATLGYLELVSHTLYGEWGQSFTNITIGVLSAVIDNIPLMFSVLTMNPSMSEGQWLLVTLTAGVGGSLLSIGSAAGVALMGQAKGNYTFMSHFKWSWAILLGYIAAISCHFWLNQALF